jgi:hypothetical protein
MGKTDPKTTYQDPDDIHKGTQATWFIRFGDYIFSKGYECQHGKFQGLHTEWNPDDGYTQQDASDNIQQKDD